MLQGIKILLILTSQATMGNSDHQTGVWMEELTTPYYAFIDAGAEVEIASIQGEEIPVDPRSIDRSKALPESVQRFLADQNAVMKLKHSLKIDDLSSREYAAIFLPGGHGTMWDLPNSDYLAIFLSDAWQQGKILAAVCHGPAGLVNVRDEFNQPLVNGKKVSAFTNEEENAVGLSDTVPFLLETQLRALGADYQKGSIFQPFAVKDGNLITGQNPASSEKVAKLIIQTLEADKQR